MRPQLSNMTEEELKNQLEQLYKAIGYLVNGTSEENGNSGTADH